MKHVKLFYLKNCPYCKRAMECIDDIKRRCPELRSVEIEAVEENEHADIAEQYDYHYVPAFYVDERKVHEGAATDEQVERVLRAAL